MFFREIYAIAENGDHSSCKQLLIYNMILDSWQTKSLENMYNLGMIIQNLNISI